MKTIVITGSAGGFGLECAKVFRENNYNVVISDINKIKLNEAKEKLEKIKVKAGILAVPCDVTKVEDLENLVRVACDEFKTIEFFINNAGVNQRDAMFCDLKESEIEFLLNIDLIGAMNGSRIAFNKMKEQGFGQIYNVEGFGSDDQIRPGLTLYGTSKRAITYFTKSLAKESEKLTKGAVKVCRLTPGIMITDFITNANGGKTKMELDEKTQKIYNILGDYPETIARFVVPRMIKNKKNDANIIWLTGRRALGKFISWTFKKRDFFN